MAAELLDQERVSVTSPPLTTSPGRPGFRPTDVHAAPLRSPWSARHIHRRSTITCRLLIARQVPALPIAARPTEEQFGQQRGGGGMVAMAAGWTDLDQNRRADRAGVDQQTGDAHPSMSSTISDAVPAVGSSVASPCRAPPCPRGGARSAGRDNRGLGSATGTVRGERGLHRVVGRVRPDDQEVVDR